MQATVNCWFVCQRRKEKGERRKVAEVAACWLGLLSYIPS